MTPEQLKASILQMAIQGKLVEQRSEEGTAEELYDQIQAEKQKLIKEGKIKKEKTLAEIAEDEIPFDIPESWKWCYIGELFLHNTGKAQNSSGTQNGAIRKFITTSNIYWNKFDFTKVKEMPFTDQELERCTVKKGDLLVCEGGDCGRSAIWNYDEEVCIQNHVHRLRPYKELDIYYFYYIFYLYKNTGRLRGKGVAIQGLSNEAIHKVIIPLPPLKEQHRIVAKIEELLPYVDRYAEAYEKLEQLNAKFPENMKKSILQYAIQGKLVEQRPEEGTAEEMYQQIQCEKQKLIKEGKIKKEKPLAEITEDEIPFDIPESWKWVRLSALCKSITDGDHQPPPQATEGYPFVVISNVSSGYLNLSNTRHVGSEYFNSLSDDRIAEKGDILFTVTGSYGIVINVDIDEKFCFQRHIALLKLLKSQEYIYFTLQSPFIKQRCDELSTGIAQKTVGLTTLRNLLIPLPPYEEQKRIISKLKEVLPFCDRLVK